MAFDAGGAPFGIGAGIGAGVGVGGGVVGSISSTLQDPALLNSKMESWRLSRIEEELDRLDLASAEGYYRPTLHQAPTPASMVPSPTAATSPTTATASLRDTPTSSSPPSLPAAGFMLADRGTMALEPGAAITRMQPWSQQQQQQQQQQQPWYHQQPPPQQQQQQLPSPSREDIHVLAAFPTSNKAGTLPRRSPGPPTSPPTSLLSPTGRPDVRRAPLGGYNAGIGRPEDVIVQHRDSGRSGSLGGMYRTSGSGSSSTPNLLDNEFEEDAIYSKAVLKSPTDKRIGYNMDMTDAQKQKEAIIYFTGKYDSLGRVQPTLPADATQSPTHNKPMGWGGAGGGAGGLANLRGGGVESLHNPPVVAAIPSMPLIETPSLLRYQRKYSVDSSTSGGGHPQQQARGLFGSVGVEGSGFVAPLHAGPGTADYMPPPPEIPKSPPPTAPTATASIYRSPPVARHDTHGRSHMTSSLDHVASQPDIAHARAQSQSQLSHAHAPRSSMAMGHASSQPAMDGGAPGAAGNARSSQAALQITDQDVLQVEMFYRSHKTEVYVCQCLANLYFGTTRSNNGSPTKSPTRPEATKWDFYKAGIPVLVLDTGESRRNRRLHVVLAERGTGFYLWKDCMNHLSNYTAPHATFHTLSLSNDHTKMAGFSFDDAAAAGHFLHRIHTLTSDPDDDILNLSGQGKKKKSKLPKGFKGDKKKKAPTKADISSPCCFTHVTKLDRSDGMCLLSSPGPSQAPRAAELAAVPAPHQNSPQRQQPPLS